MSLSIEYVINRHYAVWGVGTVTPYIAMLGKHSVGGYGISGWHISTYVVGEQEGILDASFDNWKARCELLKGKYFDWRIEERDGIILVRYDYDELCNQVIGRLCNAKWSSDNRAWLVPLDHRPYLDFLTKIEFPDNPW